MRDNESRGVLLRQRARGAISKGEKITARSFESTLQAERGRVYYESKVNNSAKMRRDAERSGTLAKSELRRSRVSAAPRRGF